MGGSDLKRNCRKFHLTAFASNFELIARSQKYKKVHKGSQATEFLRKSVFVNPAILVACKRYEAGMYASVVYRPAKRDYIEARLRG